MNETGEQMANEYAKLNGEPRILMEIELDPVQGTRFQPTGFADLGAAVFERPEGKRMILVESAQSIANRLESTCLDGTGPKISKELEGLPYILVRLSGEIETETSSLIEAHRINSPFIISDGEFKKRFTAEAKYVKGKPLDWRSIGKTLFRYDPNSLLHGVFMANLEDGRIKMPRALTGFIEAEDVREAASGGVKNNPLDPSGKMRAENYDKDVYGNVPYHRMEYTAGKITAFFNLDLSLIEGYGLPAEASDLLVSLALFKIRKFLKSGLRLRTACDLKVKGELKVIAPTGFAIPDEATLLSLVQSGIAACKTKGLFNSPPVLEIKTKVKVSKKPVQGKENEDGPSENKDGDSDSNEDELGESSE
ncbi:MAG: type I-U CRISPR-associated protein Cas7 [Thermoplasmata archaeon]|nr:type I-U CRISPR-associated protein Cas7 [Candidatus Sysuiplasma jiujiangense]